MPRKQERWRVSLSEIMTELRTDKPDPLGPEKARAALIARLEQLCHKPVKPPKSLQPTPEAAKSKIRRLRHKQRLLIQRSKQADRAQRESSTA